MKCRGEETRFEITSEYDINPIAHVQILEGQTKTSCTGDLLTDSYYCFSYVHKKKGEKGTFYCGSHAAKDFLRLINANPLPLFNPLVSENKGRTGGGTATKGTAWDATAKQLSNAINLLIVCWDITPDGAIEDIKKNTEKYFYNTPFPSEVKAVNTILSRDPKGRTLKDMVDELRSENTIRNFDFNLLNDVLTTEGVPSSFYG